MDITSAHCQPTTINQDNHKIPQSMPTSFFSWIKSLVMTVFIILLAWWGSFPYTVMLHICCNTFKKSEDPCAFCDCETYDVDNLTMNLIQSIAVDADHNTFLDKASDIGISLKTLKQDQDSDPQLQEIIAKLQLGKASQCMQSKHLLDAHGVLHFNADIYSHVQPVIYLPQKYRKTVLTVMNDNLGHLGVQRTYNIIRQSYYWPQLYNDVSKYCEECEPCQRQMLQKEKQPMQTSSVPKYPFQKIAVDLVGPVNFQSYDGNQYILTCMDMLTSWVEAFPLESKDTKLVGRLIIEHIICHSGCPEELISDNGGEFCSKVIDEICSELSIKRSKQHHIMPKQMGNWKTSTNCLLAQLRKMFKMMLVSGTKLFQKCSLPIV